MGRRATAGKYRWPSQTGRRWPGPGWDGCASNWTEETLAAHYENLCAFDNRLVLAGEHASYLPGWQEGALLSSLDAIGRLHRRVLAG